FVARGRKLFAGKETKRFERKRIVSTLRIETRRLTQSRGQLTASQQMACEKCGLGLLRQLLRCQTMLVALSAPSLIFAQPVSDKPVSDKSAKVDQAVADQPVVVATVDNDPIYAGEVQAMLKVIPRQKTYSDINRARVEGEILNQLIGRRLVVHYLRRKDQAISHHHIDDAVADLRKNLEAQKQALDGFLKKQGITESALRADFDWRLSWESYINNRVTDDVLKKHFDKHRADHDGRQLKLKHLLLKFKDQGHNDKDQRIAEAQRIRDQITADQLTFEDAVQQYSQAPSRNKGGDTGFVHRHGEMVEPFLQAAFQLQPGQISPPVTTPFGVHLILCSELKPGDKKWADVRDELRHDVIFRGFKAIVDVERQEAQVHFTGRGAYIDPDSGELRCRDEAKDRRDEPQTVRDGDRSSD
ncbi:MAG: peptidylprolyl isomerase, partial [Planctomycetales bacterium]